MAKKTKPVTVTEITADQWAESGGTAGIFAKKWKAGTLRIVSEDETGAPVVVRKAKGDA